MINMNINAKKHFSMASEKNRLDSFKNWPFSDDSMCSASKMAEAGFYFTGGKKDPDAVTCYVCCKSLDGWENEDDPWLEHQQHTSNCSFAKLGKPEDELIPIQFFEFQKDQINNYFNKRKEIFGVVDNIITEKINDHFKSHQ